MKLISQIVIMGLAISLIAGLMIPAIEEVAPGEEGEKIVIDGKNEGFERYSKINDFVVEYFVIEGASQIHLLDRIHNVTTNLPKDDPAGYLLGNYFQIYRHNNAASIMTYGEEKLESYQTNFKATFKDDHLDIITIETVGGSAQQVHHEYDCPGGFIYAPYENGEFVRTNGNDNAIFNKDGTIDGGHVGDSPRGFVQLVNGSLVWGKWGGTSGYGTIQPDTPFSIGVAEPDTTLYKITDNKYTYIASGKTEADKETKAIDMWFMPYEYHYEEGGGGETGPLANLFWILPTMAIVGVIVGAVRHITGRED